MDNNTIYREGETIGYYQDLEHLYRNLIDRALNKYDYEEAGYLIEEVQELNKHKDYKGILIMSDNNGMGLTVKPYRGED